MSQWTALTFVPPMNGKPLPSARWIVPSIFSSKSDVLRVPLDARIAADAELAEHPGAVVGVERLQQEVLVRRGRRFHDTTILEAETDVLEGAAAVGSRVLRERDRAARRVLDRAVEDLAARHVRADRIHVAGTALEAEGEIGPVTLDPDVAGGVEVGADLPHALGQRFPVDEHRAVEEVLVRPEPHARVLRERRRRELAADPGLLSREERLHVRSSRLPAAA